MPDLSKNRLRDALSKSGFADAQCGKALPFRAAYTLTF